MNTTTRILFGIVAGGVLSASGLGLSRAAFADIEGNPNASCMGHEASAVSPPGTLTGFYSAQGMPGVLQFVDEVVIPLTGAANRGQVISSGPAQVNGDHTLATHEACDEALGIPEGAE